MSNYSTCPTPVDTKPKLGATTDAPYDDPTQYRQLADALQTWCLHMHDPRNARMHALKRILRYIQGTHIFGLHLYKFPIGKFVSYTDVV